MCFTYSRPLSFSLAVVSVLGCAQDHVNPAIARPELAVVRISSTRLGSNPGCGFLISANGLLVTTARLAAGDAAIGVTLADGRNRVATFVEEDREADVAVLKIAGDNYPFLTLRNDDSEPVMHIRIVEPTGISYGLFDRWENSGQAMGFTSRAMPADAGAPLLADDGSAIGVVRKAPTNSTSPQLATPIWHVIRMLPAPAK